jgi:hypothetical protein
MRDQLMAKRTQAEPTRAAYSTPGATRTKTVKTTGPKVAAAKTSNSKSAPNSRPGEAVPKKAARRQSRSSEGGNRPVIRGELARRLREIRKEIFGEHGGPELARRLDLPARTWYGYETGTSVPAELLLGFIEQTGANPMFVLTGKGPKYQGD